MYPHDISRIGGRVALFLSTFTNKIDKKGRVSIPAPFRTVLSCQSFQGIVLFRSVSRPVLDGCGLDRLTRLSEQLETGEFIPSANHDYTSMMFAEAQMLSFDAEGRVSIPEDLLHHASISEQITFVGRGPTFELWSPAAFAADHDQRRQKLTQHQRGES